MKNVLKPNKNTPKKFKIVKKINNFPHKPMLLNY